MSDAVIKVSGKNAEIAARISRKLGIPREALKRLAAREVRPMAKECLAALYERTGTAPAEG